MEVRFISRKEQIFELKILMEFVDKAANNLGHEAS
jgi:hypothetical protein